MPPKRKRDDPYVDHNEKRNANIKDMRHNELNQKIKIRIGINNVDKPFHSGTCKEAYEAVLAPEFPVFNVSVDEFSANDFVILRYADNDSCSHYYNK